jgi:putative oxidoreductase
MDDLVNLVFGTYPSRSHLIVRLALGVIFFAHGAQKVFGWFGGQGLSGTISGFRQMGIPPALSVTAALVEGVGGLAVLVGFLTRPAAVGLAIVMLVAIQKVHLRHGFFLNWGQTPGRGHGYEFNLALLAMAVSVVVGGGGMLSVDYLIAPWGD